MPKDRPQPPKARAARPTLTQAEVIARSITERDFQQTVVGLAEAYGWLTHAERPARTAQGWRTPIQGDAGFPDLVLAHPEQKRLIIAELKSELGKLTISQAWWLGVLGAMGRCETYCWRPSQLAELTAILKGGVD